MIISTGMASVAEMDEMVQTIRDAGCEQFILLKCTSTYPATPGNSNVLTIPHMRKLFNCEVGLSDHTMGIGASVAAVAHGATVIEKHFTLNRADGGVDSAFSMEPEEMKQLVIETERAWQSLGAVKYGPAEAEKSSMKFRRSLYIAQDMKAGDVLNETNLRIVRPGLGLAPKYYDVILGRKVNKGVKMGTAVDWGIIY
jgi:N-acetylneuraminate synthase